MENENVKTLEEMVDEDIVTFLKRCEASTAQELLEIRGALNMAQQQIMEMAGVNLQEFVGEVLTEAKKEELSLKVLSYVAMARGVQHKVELAQYNSYLKTPECFKQ